jgi:putative (di)nucleoside polyphosphate hydrolase
VPDSNLYRPCVGIVLFNSEGKVFVGQRIEPSEYNWQMPQGGIDGDNTIEEAFFRELEEEVGTRNAKILQVAPRKLRYKLPPAAAERLWENRYIGQEQTWVAGRFLGEDSEINICAHTTPEFSNWKWIALEDTIDLIVPFKRDVYREVIEMFSVFAGK